MLRWAEADGVAVGLVGSGSNLLVADDGFHGLAIKLDGDLAAIERDGERILCGGGARLPSAAAKAAGWGLSGLEFGINIPGTAGGAVRMNANAYGGQLARVLDWVEVSTAAGTERRTPERLGFSYRRSNLRGGEVVSRASFRAAPRRPEPRSAPPWRRCASAAATPSPRGSRPSARPSRTPRTSAPRAARPGSCSTPPAAAACSYGGARFSEKHANFVENTGDASTADVLELMAEGRRRVHAKFGRRAGAGGPGAGRGGLAQRLGAVSRIWRGIVVILVVIAAGAIFQLLFGDETVTGTVRIPLPVATIGSGEEAVAVAASGAVVPWWPLSEEPELPQLPPTEVPKGGQFAGPMLQQVRILGAAPEALRPYLASSRYGESGVDVETTAGIELRFGDASQAEQKWKAAAAVLADPEITALDYVDLHAPARPAYGGSGHTLPALP